jgi:uncharacterized membrane protein
MASYAPQSAETERSLVNWTTLIYALHAFGIATGIFGAATVVGAFLIGWPSLIAVILNYVKRGDVRGTWLDSHFSWQIRTFWFGLLWAALGVFVAIFTLGLGLILVLPAFGVLAIWLTYRVVRGWVRLNARRPMYA